MRQGESVETVKTQNSCYDLKMLKVVLFVGV